MKPKAKKSTIKKIALTFCLSALIVWSILGTGTSLAWFTDTSPQINNIFHFADFDVVVSHPTVDGGWEKVDSQTRIFNDEALYEPGYVQTAFLKVENKGTQPFKFYTAVNVNGCILATNVFGQKFMLQDYLKFGIMTADSEKAIKNSISNREKATEIADMPLHNYDTETAILNPNETKYIVLVVRMPNEVGNVANYRGDTVPKVELGITVKADQVID